MQDKVINGRLYTETESGIYKPVPRGMDDAKAMKLDPPPGVVLQYVDTFELTIEPMKYAEELHKKGVPSTFAEKNGNTTDTQNREQEFVQIDKNIGLMVPQGEERILLPQTIKKGGYINVTDPANVYGISEKDFHDAYRITRVQMPETQAKPKPAQSTRDMRDLEAACADIEKSEQSAEDQMDF